VKPLYWAEVPGGVVYASEPVAILACGMVAARPDPMAIVEYLTLQYVPAPRSGFDTIRKLAPGEVLVFENGAATVDCYWSLPEEKDESHLGDDLLLRQLDELIGDATRRRLISDVPLGAFLSGGLDSTLVVGYMADALSQVRTFSIDFPDAAYSEAEAARAVASLYGTDHQELRVEPDIVPVIAAASQAAGEPFADSSAVPTYLLSQLTRQHVKVALSGDGGDEAFGGYWRYLRATRADRVDAARPLARAAVALAGAIVPQTHSSPPGRLALLALPPQERYAAMVSHFQPPAIDRLLQPDFLANAGGSRIGWEELLALPTRPSVNSYARLDTKTYLPGALLTKVDRMSMAHGLEVRSPFLDYRIHEFAASVPARAKLRGQTTKWLLRRLAAHRGVPARIVDRPKKGFSMPIGKWFRGELRGWLTELLIDGRAASRGYFRPGVVERLLGEHLDGTVDHSSRLWNLAMLELWHREWIDG
jgi:asparagine synthase (glutamine-hydrolysing)